MFDVKNKVYLVGAGSGDPELLTMKGWRCLKEADVVVYDRLVNPVLLHLTNPKAKLIYAGKEYHHHAMTQDEINRTLIQLAKEKQSVVRLKGGDPSVYGRVAEEMAALDEAGLPYEVIPGVTSAFSATVYAGIIATERHVSEKVGIFTPTAVLHELSEEPMQELCQGGTVVLYMGLNRLGDLVAMLKQQEAQSLPMAVIEWGTWGRQRKILTTVQEVEQEVKAQNFHSPSLIVLGEAVRNASPRSWFESLPRFGQSFIYVMDQHDDLEQVFQYIREGADVYPLFVGKAHDPRFNAMNHRILGQYGDIHYADEVYEKYHVEVEEMVKEAHEEDL